jgi:arylsulfatase
MHKLLTALITGTALTAAASAAPKTSRPAPVRANILVIVLDDVGYSDLGAFGSEIRTPNLDAVAAKGLRYTRFDTRAVCSATRAALLTGRNNQTLGMENLPSHGRFGDQRCKSRRAAGQSGDDGRGSGGARLHYACLGQMAPGPYL